MVPEVILVSIALATVVAFYVMNKKAVANLTGIVATITTQVDSYKKSVAAHLDIIEATTPRWRLATLP